MHDGHGHLCFVNSTATRICINEVCHSIFVSYLLNLDAFNSGCVQFLKYFTVDLVRLNDFDILPNGGSNSKNLCYLVFSLSLVQLLHIWCVSFLVFTLSQCIFYLFPLSILVLNSTHVHGSKVPLSHIHTHQMRFKAIFILLLGLHTVHSFTIKF